MHALLQPNSGKINKDVVYPQTPKRSKSLRVLVIKSGISENGSRYENEQYAKSSCNEKGVCQGNQGTLVEKSAHIWLLYSLPVHERILAEPQQSHDRVNLVLVCRNEIGRDNKREYNLYTVRQLILQSCQGILTQHRVDLGLSVKTTKKDAQKAPQKQTSPNARRARMLRGTRLPRAFACRKPGKASLSIA
jgi:hypothetical protein